MIKRDSQAADPRVMAISSPLLSGAATASDHVDAPDRAAGSPTALTRGVRSRRRRVVGLEITDSTVRAVSMPPAGSRSGDALRAEVELPVGAVRHGEILDPAAVSDALRTLWKVGRFPTTRVVVGIGNSDVVTRQMEMADLDDKDLRLALRYEIVDMIPFPVADSILDLVRVEMVEDDSSLRHARVLGVAALRSPLQALVSVTRDAGLDPVAIDLTPFALIRAVSAGAVDETEAIVHLGDSSITVVVHRNGVPRFTRGLATSASGLGISHELEAELQLIEQYIQRTAGGEVDEHSATFDPSVSAIRGTLDYYALQAGAVPITRVTLTGDNAWAAAIAASVESLIGVPVGLSDPMNAASPYQASPFIASVGTSSYVTALGLAQAPGGQVVGPEVLNLLPGRDQSWNWRTHLTGSIVAAAVTALLLIGLGLVAGPDSDAAQADADRAESSLATTRARLAFVAPALHDAVEVTILRRHLGELSSTQIDWPRILGEIRAGVPADATLLSIMAKAPTITRAGRQPGSIQLSGQTLSYAAISSLLARLDHVPGVVDPWLVSARAGQQGDVSSVTTFAITMNLDGAAVVASGDVSGPNSNGAGR